MPNAVTRTYTVGAPQPRPQVDSRHVDPRLADVEAIARWFDYAFALPGGFRFGFAGIIGLIPGIGDLIDALVSLFIVYRAIQLGVARVTLARMMVNVGIEAIFGSVPILGDLFDVAFKANRRNYQLLCRHIEEPRRQTALDWVFLIGIFLLAALSVALPVWAIITLAKRF